MGDMARRSRDRKNFLFVGSEATMNVSLSYSLIGTARLNGADPKLFLCTVLAPHRRPYGRPD